MQNPLIKKKIEMEMPKFDYKLNKQNDFTTDDLQRMCEIISLKYPF